MSSTGASVPLAMIAPGLHQLLPDVGAFLGALRPEPRQHVRRVRGGVNPLHRRDHAELPEARDVGGADVLRVLDPPAQLPCRSSPDAA